VAPTNKEIRGKEPKRDSIWLRLSPGFQQITWLGTDAGKVVEARSPRRGQRVLTVPKVRGKTVRVGVETSRHEVCPLGSAPVRLHPMLQPSNCTFWQSPSWSRRP